ncbi:DUF6266 family protein [Algibacter pacificus]|uniref:DUF6266 family protein n=1 Tax=Algibacter pacificus TaxID=2599389 RepID=UPI0011C97A5A|nr:DUF6266 family protein [Algibacter pacificus]
MCPKKGKPTKVGNIIGGSWKGINYIRIKPTSVANPRTEGQVNQRNKFTIALEYLQATKSFIKIGYKSFATKKTEFNAAMSYVLNNAIAGVAPDFTIDYSLALLSRGDLSGVIDGSTDLSQGGEITFNWADNSDEGNASATDKAMVLVYNPNRRDSVSILDGANRSVGSQVITIPNTYTDETVEMFMAFVSADGKKVSNSVYLGSGTTAP